jgi:hypothetical protein
VVLALSLSISANALAYIQNLELEDKLRDNDSRALALFPVMGYRDGAAGYFRDQSLRVVPGSQRAWCQAMGRGVLKPGCYVELYFHPKGLNDHSEDGKPCGLLLRWFQSSRTDRYVPTEGSPFAKAMAKGEWDFLESNLYDPPIPANLKDARNLARCSARKGKY